MSTSQVLSKVRRKSSNRRRCWCIGLDSYGVASRWVSNRATENVVRSIRVFSLSFTSLHFILSSNHRVLSPLNPFAGSGLGHAGKTIPLGFHVFCLQTMNSRSFTMPKGVCKLFGENKKQR